MSDKRNRTSRALPVCFAIAFALGTSGFFLAEYYTEMAIGSPSSTSALVFVFLLPYAVISGLVGAVIGYLITEVYPFCGFKPLSKLRSIGLLFLISSAIVCAPTFLGFIITKFFINHTRPRVLFTNGIIYQKAGNPNPLINKESLLLNDKSLPDTLIWNNKKISITFSDRSIKIRHPGRNLIAKESLWTYEYISEVQAIEGKLFPEQENYLAILADLRATSHRAMLYIYSPKAELVYQEMLESYGQIKLFTEKDPNSNLEILHVKHRRTDYIFLPLEEMIQR